MSDFITDAEWQFEKYCEIAEEYGFVDLNAKKSGFRCTTKTAEFNAGWISFTGGVAAVCDEQQATIDDLKAKLSEVQRVIDIYEDGDIDSLSDFARYVKQALRGAND